MREETQLWALYRACERADVYTMEDCGIDVMFAQWRGQGGVEVAPARRPVDYSLTMVTWAVPAARAHLPDLVCSLALHSPPRRARRSRNRMLKVGGGCPARPARVLRALREFQFGVTWTCLRTRRRPHAWCMFVSGPLAFAWHDMALLSALYTMRCTRTPKRWTPTATFEPPAHK